MQFHYPCFVAPLEFGESWLFCDRASPFTPRRYNAATSAAVNAAVAASQWRIRAWSFPLHLCVNTAQKAVQAPSTVIFATLWDESSNAAVVLRLQFRNAILQSVLVQFARPGKHSISYAVVFVSEFHCLFSSMIERCL